jgi:hypothetical protein
VVRIQLSWQGQSYFARADVLLTPRRCASRGIVPYIWLRFPSHWFFLPPHGVVFGARPRGQLEGHRLHLSYAADVDPLCRPGSEQLTSEGSGAVVFEGVSSASNDNTDGVR